MKVVFIEVDNLFVTSAIFKGVSDIYSINSVDICVVISADGISLAVNELFVPPVEKYFEYDEVTVIGTVVLIILNNSVV